MVLLVNSCVSVEILRSVCWNLESFGIYFMWLYWKFVRYQSTFDFVLFRLCFAGKHHHICPDLAPTKEESRSHWIHGSIHFVHLHNTLVVLFKSFLLCLSNVKQCSSKCWLNVKVSPGSKSCGHGGSRVRLVRWWGSLWSGVGPPLGLESWVGVQMNSNNSLFFENLIFACQWKFANLRNLSEDDMAILLVLVQMGSRFQTFCGRDRKSFLWVNKEKAWGFHSTFLP